MALQKLLFIFGTRPEAIKMAPLITQLRQRPDRFEVQVCVTAQHREMLDQVLKLFDLRPEYDLDLMTAGQDLTDLTCRILTGLKPVLAKSRPHRVLVHGDTTTTLGASLAAFYAKIPVAHVEAGLRTGDRYAPWPEEMNRKITTAIADLHFAPTERARQSLLAENVPDSQIHVTGNTVIDALLAVVGKVRIDAGMRDLLGQQFNALDSEKKLVLVTGHRRENFGVGLENICQGLLRVMERFPDTEIVYPVHRNPSVQNTIFQFLGNASEEVRGRLHLIDPLDYLPFVYLMERSHFIITDSGGVQEEGPSLGKPVLVTREISERPEAVAAGTVRLVGTDATRLFDDCERLMTDPDFYSSMSQAHNPYGDGRASERISDILREVTFQ